MELQEIISAGRPIEDIIEDLQQKAIAVPEWSSLAENYNQDEHRIKTDSTLRPKDKTGADGQKEVSAKITYPAEKIATRRMAQMAFSIPVRRIYDIHDEDGKDEEDKKQQARAIEAIYKSVRIDGQNMKRMKAYFAACEIATIWYAVDTKKVHKKYGFETPLKLRCRSYSPMPMEYSRITQAELYPLFDEFDDMVAMSFMYVRTEEEDKEVTYFETFTADTHYKWRKGEDDWEEAIPPEKITILKIPCIYLWRPLPIYEGISNNRDEIEFTLSRFSDIIRKNSRPIVKVVGGIEGDGPVGDYAREVYRLKDGGDIGLVSPAISPESVQYHVKQLKENIEEDLQLPNLSMENIKGLGVQSGESRKTLLTDGHLKTGDEKHDIIEFLDREFNIIKAFVGIMNLSWKDSIDELQAEHVITPFIQNDETAEIEKLTKATGGKPIMAQKTAIKQLGFVEDADVELQQMQDEDRAEAENERMTDVFNGAM